MKDVLKYIEVQTAKLKENPFVRWLSDESIPPKERLSKWLPCFAYFVFAFKDLNEVMKYPDDEAKVESLKKGINDHCDEDSTHWPWFITDFKELKLDQNMNFSKALQFLWGNETKAQRISVYKLCKLSTRAENPLLRYSLIEALEAGAHLFFSTIFNVSQNFKEETGVELLFLGATHFEREPGHLVNQPDAIEKMFDEKVLEEDMKSQAIEIARSVFDITDTLWRGLYQFVESDYTWEF